MKNKNRDSKGRFIKGHIPTKEMIEKTRKANLGRKCPEEHKKRMSKIAKKLGYGKWMKGRKLSPKTIKKMLIGRSKHWKLRTINWCGYVLIKCPNHPNQDKDGYVREHRIVMEKHLGRYLTKKEVVHHINGKKSDNRIGNLILFADDREHKLIAHSKRK